MENIFDVNISNSLVNRIESLQASKTPIWGKMSVDQMLAHCNVTYEMVYDNKHKKATGFKKFMLNLFVKPIVVNEKPYKKNGRTAPEFLIIDSKNFEAEKNRLIDYIKKTQELGELHFENKESNSFGILTSKEWNNMFYKHLDHHLNQFSV